MFNVKKMLVVCLLSGAFLLILSGCVSPSVISMQSSAIDDGSQSEDISISDDSSLYSESDTTSPYSEDIEQLFDVPLNTECNGSAPNDDENTSQDNDIINAAENGIYDPDGNDIPGFDEYKHLIAETLGYSVSNVPVIETKRIETALLGPGATSTVLIFDVYKPSVATVSVIVIDTDGDIVCEISNECSYSADFYFADVDGDGYAEILAHHDTGGNGGAGSHETVIYKLVGDRLTIMFSYPIHNDTYGGYQSDMLDTGFTLTVSDGWKHTVYNEHTGLSFTFIREVSTEESLFFDEYGNITDYAKNIQKEYRGIAICDPFFYVFEPIDVDGDGIYEIMTAQYSSLWGRDNDIGTAYTILKWNVGNGKMDVQKTGFWHYTAEQEDTDDFYQRWHDYQDNWYKD